MIVETEQRLILVRHGETESNIRRALDTRPPGARLTARGEAQAQALAEQWSDAGLDALVRSHLLRTELTIRHLAEATRLPVIVREGLTEVEAGDWEMATDTEALNGYYGTVEAWHDGDLHRRLPGGESGDEVLERFDAVIDEVTATGVLSPLIVSHGAVIRLWVAARASGITADHAFRTPLRNACAIVAVRDDPDVRWRFQSWQEQPPGEQDRAPSEGRAHA